MNEFGLDPQSDEDWATLKKNTHQVVDEMFDFLKNIRQQPVWTPIAQRDLDAVSEKLPWKGSAFMEVYRQFKESILPYPAGNIHPRFWGYVQGTGTPEGSVTEFLMAALNSNVGGREHIAPYVEKEILEWAKEITGFASASSATTSSGVLTSGCSIANLIALNICRNSKANYDIKLDGISLSTNTNSEEAHASGRMMFYSSTEVHCCVTKAVQILGLGLKSLKKIGVDEKFRMKTDLLREAIQQDIDAGNRPCCVIVTIGSANTGAIDPLDEILEIAKEFSLWVHVDGAFGALLNLLPEYKERLKGLATVDSLAFDFHKWFSIPYDVGCVLVRDKEVHKQTFTDRAAYLNLAAEVDSALEADANPDPNPTPKVRGLGGGEVWFADYGIQLSRSFRALKIWFMIKLHGMEKYQSVIQMNIDQVRYFGKMVEDAEDMELLAPLECNVCVFRFIDRFNIILGKVSGEERTDEINEEILYRLQESGIAAPSATRVNGKYGLRIAHVNHRSTRDDFDLLFKTVRKLGNQISLNLSSSLF